MHASTSGGWDLNRDCSLLVRVAVDTNDSQPYSSTSTTPLLFALPPALRFPSDIDLAPLSLRFCLRTHSSTVQPESSGLQEGRLTASHPSVDMYAVLQHTS